jgi:hypothetical protein
MTATKQQSRMTRDTVSARVDPALRKFLELVAKSERRSVSGVVRIALEDWRASCARSTEQRAAR